ncbi:hypothetical protein BsWGS_16530 [Bradybaena similaris]
MFIWQPGAHDPEVTSAGRFKDGITNAPAVEATKMHRQIRQSSRFSSKGESGSVTDVKNIPEPPKREHERQKPQSAPSVRVGSYICSSRSPSPGRRVRTTRATVRKIEQSRSSSLSSSDDESSKKQHGKNASSRSGSRSPNAISPKMPATRSRRQSDADQAAVRDLPHGGSGDQSAGQNENADKIVSANSRKKWRKKQPQAHESPDANEREESATTPVSSTAQRWDGGDTNSKDKGPGEHEQDTREVVSSTMLSTTPNFPAEKSVSSAGKTKEELSSKQKSDQDERIVEDSSASAKGPQNLSRRPQSRSSSSGSSSAESRSRSRSTGGKKGSGSGSSSSSSSSSESRSSGSSSDSSVQDSPKKAAKADGEPRTAGRKLAGAQEKVDEADKMEVDSTKNTSLATRNTGHSDRDNQASTVQVSGEAKFKEEQQNSLEKEQNRSTEARESHGMAQDWPDDNSNNVADASEKSKDADDETAAKKGIKRRKWNSKASKAAKTSKRTASMEISTDVLKNLIGDVKLTETVFEMETEVVNMLDYDDQEEDQRDVKVKRAQSPSKEEKPEEEDARRVETRDASPELAEVPSEPEKKIIKLSSAAPKAAVKTKLKEGKKSKEEKKGDAAEKEKKQAAVAVTETKEKVVATNRVMKSLMPVVDEPEPVTGHQSPAINPPDRVIRIAGLVRPFTVNQLKELLRRSGELDDEYFWISEIKSHCMAAYKTQEQATAARAALHGTRWPQSNPKILFVDFATIDDVLHAKQEGGVAKPSPVKRPVEEQQHKVKEPKPKPVEKEEKKHKAKEPRERSRVDREKEERETRDRKREPEKKNLVREWDRDKIKQLSRSRSKSKERDHAVRRSRSRDREQRKRGEYRKEKREEDRRKEKKPKEVKAEEEPPAKLLDDLFRKTKATPCIYWLPLTEEQAQQIMAKKQEKEKERQKRIAAEEKEELKKREAARLERHRERDRAREKSREKDRDRNRPERKTSRSSSRSRSRRRR